MNKKIVLFGIGIFFIALAFSQPPSFHQFYGQVVYENGTIVNSTLSVKAFINGSIMETVESDEGNYGYSPLMIVEGGRNGDVITFTLDNYFATNFTFVEEGLTEMNLTYNVSAEVICVDSDDDGYSPSIGNCGPVDCNDDNFAIHPGRGEDCDTLYDDNCDGFINENCGGDNPSGNSPGSGSTTPPGGDVSPYFELDINNLEITVEQGKSENVSFTISNPTGLHYDVYISKELGFITLSENNFEIEPDSSKTITIVAHPGEGLAPDTYLDTIFVRAGQQQEAISLDVNVVSVGSIFDIVVDVDSEDEYIWQGETLDASFLMKRIVPVESNTGVNVTYYIRDRNDKDYYTFNEERDIKDEDTFEKEFVIPQESPNGEYALIAKVVYDNGKVASASASFDIGPRPLSQSRWFIILVLIILGIIVVVIIIIIQHKKNKRFFQLKKVQNPSISS